MAVNPEILQQYIDEYEGELDKWKRKSKTYNKAIDTYNDQVSEWKTKNDQAFDVYKAAVDRYNANEAAYLQNNPDVANGVAQGHYPTGRAHYLDRGYREGRWVPPGFADDAKNINDATNSLHKVESTRPSAPSAINGLFNEKIYLQNNPDVAAMVAKGQFKSGLDHYLQQGYKENRNAASGGLQNEKALQEAAAWQANTTSQFDKYLVAVDQSRFFGSNAEALSRAGTPAVTEALKGYATPEDIQRASSLVNAIYQTYLGRPAEVAGLNYWAAEFTGGAKTPQQLIDELQQSDEAKKYAATKNAPVTAAFNTYGANASKVAASLVNTAYQTYLGRAADTDGLNYWTAAIGSGASPQAVIDAIKQSDDSKAYAASKIAPVTSALSALNANKTSQNATALVNATYQAYLGRAADTAGLNYWATAITNGADPQAVIDGIKQSKEAATYSATKEAPVTTAFNTYKTGITQAASTLVNTAYQTYLGRAADTAGLNYWTAAIGSGASPQAVIDGIKQSDDSKAYAATQSAPVTSALSTYTGADYAQDTKNLIAATFKTYLGRDPDQEGLNYWTNEVISGRKAPQDLINSIKQSQEAITFGGKMVDTKAQAAEANKLKTQYEALEKARPGFDWFTGQKTPGRVTNALATGDPAKIVQATYSAYLGRQPDAPGFAYWKNAIANKELTPEQAINAIRRSEESSSYSTQYHGVAPTFTQKQMNAMQGQQTLAQQERTGENEPGLISRIQGQKQSPDSILGGILQSARYST